MLTNNKKFVVIEEGFIYNDGLAELKGGSGYCPTGDSSFTGTCFPSYSIAPCINVHGTTCPPPSSPGGYSSGCSVVLSTPICPKYEG